MATDYDTPRKTDDELAEDSLEELKARRVDASSGAVDADEAEAAESLRAARRRPVQRGALGPRAPAAGRRVHLLALLPGPPPQPAGQGGRRAAGLPGVRRLTQGVRGVRDPSAPAPGTGPGSDRHAATPARTRADARARPTPRRSRGSRGAAGTGAGRRARPAPGQARMLGQLAYALSRQRAQGRVARRRPAAAGSPTSSSTRPRGSRSATSRRCAASTPGSRARRWPTSSSRSAARATTAVGRRRRGASTGLKWSVPVTLITIPIQLAVEVAAVAAIEIKLVAELHEIYGAGCRGHGHPARRGVRPLLGEPARDQPARAGVDDRGPRGRRPASGAAPAGRPGRPRHRDARPADGRRGVRRLQQPPADLASGRLAARRPAAAPEGAALTDDMTGRLAHLAVERLIAPGSQGRRGLRRRGAASRALTWLALRCTSSRTTPTRAPVSPRTRRPRPCETRGSPGSSGASRPWRPPRRC